MTLFLQNLIQSLRNLQHTRWQSAVSVIGLSVGIISLTLSLNWLWSETHYDRFRHKSEQLYVAVTSWSYGSGESALHIVDSWANYDHYTAIKQALQGTGASIGGFKSHHWEKQRIKPADNEEKAFISYTQYMDSACIATLQPRVLVGDAEALFQGEDKILLTETLARKLFHSPDSALGQLIKNDSWGTRTVVGVVEDCEKESNIYYDAIIRYVITDNDRDPGNWNFQLLIRTPNIDKTLQRMPELVNRNVKNAPVALSLVPLGMAHKLGEGATFIKAYFYPIAFATIALLLTLSALVNLIMSLTSIFLGRLREYALRRSLGASTWQNNQWMLTELLPISVFTVVACAVALEWIEHFQLVPGFTDQLYITFFKVLAGTAAALLLLMLYPMWLMRRAYRRSLQGQHAGTTSHYYLLVVQCFCSAMLLFLSIGMQRQLSSMTNSDLGFDRKNILRLYTADYDYYGEMNENQKYSPFVYQLADEFRKEAGAGIIDVIQMHGDLFNGITKVGIAVITEDMLKQKEISGLDWGQFYQERPEYQRLKGFRLIELPFRAMQFFNIRTEHGVGLRPNTAPTGQWPVMLNRKACDILGLDKPAGTSIILQSRTGISYSYNHGNGPSHLNMERLYVQDVAKLRMTDFHTEDDAVVFLGIDEGHECSLGIHDALYIKHAPGRRDDAEAAVRRILTKRFDMQPEKIRLESLQEHVEYTYRDEVYYANLLTAVTVFSVFITFSGVFSLLLYSLRLRRRSMAIHRVMGASFGYLLRATLWPYILFTLIGGALAYVPARYFMRKWMEYFTEGEAPGLGFMALLLCGMLALVALLVLWQVRRAMNEKPVDVLRPEA